MVESHYPCEVIDVSISITGGSQSKNYFYGMEDDRTGVQTDANSSIIENIAHGGQSVLKLSSQNVPTPPIIIDVQANDRLDISFWASCTYRSGGYSVEGRDEAGNNP